MTTPGPGWHPDPEGNQQLRYWDGQQWTSATQPMPQPTPSPEPVDPEKLAKDRRRALIGAGVIAVLIAAYFGISNLSSRSDDTETTAAETTTTQAASTTTTASAAPTTTRIPTLPTPTSDGVMRDFWIREDRDGYATMNVNGTYTDAELESAFNEVKRMYTSTKNGDGWFIFIECGDGMNAKGGARQANGKFAVTALGAARTGLEKGGSEFEALPNRQPCPLQLDATAPGAVTADDVIAAIKDAGLPVVDPRTNTSFCAESGCVQLVTTDYFSVYQFADQAKADKFAAVWPLHYQNGLVFLRYTGDGSDPTDPALIPQYNAVLDQVMAG
ncbi:DUF2510 domain-containing protein [Rhodococcus qingshengii]|uniref:DUF2510 domain-containing protein n=1 Tax=Rhodococcus qingshengii TaxID=334542 RepID=UPI00071C4206|nr:DUF2510 domain-containing protein [Rhodococcus qingshengii]KSU80747.1 hypothetical protein AS032_08165 [Rhodococcus qingshengii]SCC10556.1 Protein of unknown function [Rhodococcus qingshengii]